MIATRSRSFPLWLLLSFVILAVLATSCNRTVPRSTPSPGKPEELAIVWEAWKDISQSYVNQEELEPQKYARAVVSGLAKELGRDPEASFEAAARSRIRPPREVPLELAPVWRFWQEVRRKNPAMDKAQQERLAQVAVESMVNLIGGPNEFIRAEDLERQQEQLRGEYVGIGALIAEVEGELVVVDTFPDSPAREAGLRPGDTIVAVGGQSIRGLTMEEASKQVRGPQGTEVTLQVQRPGEASSREFRVTRRAVRLPSIGAAVSGEVGYIRVATFYDTTGQEFVDTVFDVLKAGAKGIILDLRQNPGGSLDSAMKIASQFLREDQKLVMYEIDNAGKRTDWTIEAGGIATNVPLVVLIDENTISAGEVLAGAFQHYERATLVGKKTFGKGTVNTLLKLSNGSALYLTTSRWLTPAGKPIQDVGVEPDIRVEITARDRQLRRDSQLERALDEVQRLLSGRPEPARS